MNIHLFDVDYTLVRKSTSYYFLLEGLNRGVFSLGQFKQLPVEWLRYKLGLANEGFIEQAVKHLGGIEEDVLDTLAAAYFEKRLKSNVYTPGRDRIQDLLAQGAEVYLATSSFKTLIRPLEKFLALTGSIASDLEFSDGKTTGRLLGPALFGQNKKNAVLDWLQARDTPLGDVWFYSDSYTDLPLLRCCGHPVAVNPDRFLAREAKKQHWPVLFFRETLG